jgi:hypothetical protein
VPPPPLPSRPEPSWQAFEELHRRSFDCWRFFRSELLRRPITARDLGGGDGGRGRKGVRGKEGGSMSKGGGVIDTDLSTGVE